MDMSWVATRSPCLGESSCTSDSSLLSNPPPPSTAWASRFSGRSIETVQSVGSSSVRRARVPAPPSRAPVRSGRRAHRSRRWSTGRTARVPATPHRGQDPSQSLAKVCRAPCMFSPLIIPSPTSSAAAACRDNMPSSRRNRVSISVDRSALGFDDSRPHRHAQRARSAAQTYATYQQASYSAAACVPTASGAGGNEPTSPLGRSFK